MSNYILEGWIKTKLAYPQDLSSYGDSHQFYFSEHEKFNQEFVNKNSRIKYFEYADSETGCTYHVLFGYEDIGVKFTLSISNAETADRVEIFSNLVEKAVSGYRNLKSFFTKNISPKDTKITFAMGLDHLLIATYGFFNGLSSKQQSILVDKTEKLLKQYSTNVHIICKNEKNKKVSSDEDIKIKTLKDLEEEAGYDFIDVTVAWGDFYLYVDHYFFRSRFSMFDPSLSVNTVAYGGFVSSLVLQDIHYELKALGATMGNLRSKIDDMSKKTFPSGVDVIKEELTRLEKTYSIINSDIQEYTSLSNKIFESLDANEESKRLFTFLRLADSLPDSLFIAENMLDLNRLEYFSTFEREIVNLRSDVGILELRFNRSELGVTGLVLLSLTVVVSFLIYYNVRIDQLADFIGILTFGIALALLILRFWPKSRSSFNLRAMWGKLKSRLTFNEFLQETRVQI